MSFVALTAEDRWLIKSVIGSMAGGLMGAVQLGDPEGALQVALTFGTHCKEARVVGPTLKWLLGANVLRQDVGMLVFCSFPKGVELAIASDDPEEWKKYRAVPGCPDGNRLPQKLRASEDYVCNRVADIRELFLRKKVKYLVDVHATDGPSRPGYLGCAGPHVEHAKLIPLIGVDHYFTDVGVVQLEQGTRTYTFSAGSGAKIGSEIEVGQTGTEEARQACLQLVQDWGHAVGAFTGEPRRFAGKQTGYKMVASYMSPSPDFEVADERLLDDLAPVKEGEPILINRKTGETVVATCDQRLVWGPSNVVIDDAERLSEVYFGCVEA